MKKSTTSASETKTDQLSKSEAFAFTRENYKWVFIGLGVLALGFLLMIGGGSDDPDVYSDKIFNFQRWTLAPILVLAGFVIQIYAIMKKPKE
ncbi:MAG: DUF3098 domain-containing protein [Bacteroidales bacterium]|jgi:hypothetical protein|nr:DUF3098 domain-containing protein [Bacteroidales bacterium]MDN5350752.1 hypothetical protein [Bacteroidales bacterium]